MLLSGSTSYPWLPVLLVTLVSLPGVYNGFACLSNPCLHGVCLDDLNSTYFCYCIDGYTGVQCQTNWNECWSSPCQNGGICIDGIAMFNCSCPPGFVGDLCEEDLNECESNPCLNNGTCIDAQNEYTCSCLPGYSGERCEIDIAVCNVTNDNDTRCFNGGVCVEGPGDTFTCKCQPGWGDDLCGSEIDECLSAPCLNGAVCVDLLADYKCACLFGFMGRNCEEEVHMCEKNPCRNGALCLLEENHSVCYCVPDFHGEFCQFQYDECQLGPRCMNGGTCIDGIDNFTCSCPPQLTGVLCECLILEENELDCNYVRPTSSTTIFYNDPTTRPITTTSTTRAFETTEVPNIPTKEIVTTDMTEPLSTTFDTTTVMLITTYTPDVETGHTSPAIFSTSFGTETTTFSTEIMSSETTTELVTTEATVENEVTTGVETTAVTSEIPVYSTTAFYPNYSVAVTATTSTIPFQSSDFETSSVFPVTFTVTQNMTFPTTFVTYTTDSALEETTTLKESRSFPGEGSTTTFPIVTTFLTEQPTEATSSIKDTVTSTTITTTVSPSTTTIFGLVDCTNSHKSCLNGGTCIYTGKGHKCLCPFDTEGLYCETKLGVRKAAFNGESYLSHRLLNYAHVSLEFNASTLSNSGLLFYTSMDNTYMALYVENGFLKFKFTCGYQTMLLSELKVPINSGYTTNIKANLEFSKDYTHCDAALHINNTVTMTGDQIAKQKPLINPTVWLHLGGIPQEYTTDNIPVGGFIGCMFNLKISNKPVNIYKDAEEGYEVTECSSLACLSNPCKNGGTCNSDGDIWFCKCRNGFLGDKCEKSVCDNNPCLFGGTCLTFSSSGYICLCPYGKHGHFCENDIKITEPHFSSTVRGLSSYVAYPLPDGTSRSMEIKFRFSPTTMEQISLLLFMGQAGYHDFYSDHFAVSFVKGYVMLTWNLGSGPRRIFTSQPIKEGERDYLVRVGHFGRRAWLFVENLGNVTGRSPGSLIQLDVVPLLYLGGHYAHNFSILPHDLPLHTGFSGCIFDVEVKSGTVTIPMQGSMSALGRAVGQCGTTECFEQSCQNGGACLHHASTFMCLCQDGWYGPLCSYKRNVCENNFTQCAKDSSCVPLLSDYECDCPLGKTEKFCSKEEIITDVSLTGKRSYIALYPLKLENTKFNIEMEIKPLTYTGLLMFVGKKQTSFFSLSLQDGLLELRVQTGQKLAKINVFVVRSTKLLLKGMWHRVQLGIFGKKVYLTVDNVINTGLLDQGFFLSIVPETIYIGGLPDMSDLPIAAVSRFPVPYTGCIRHLSIDEKQISLTQENIQSARNVVDCDGTPCGGEVCQNGGSCWLDFAMNAHCSCVQPYYGDRCEQMPDCTETTCLNHGKCYNSKCSCNVGWQGVFCENEIVVKNPMFSGKSFLIVRKFGEKKRELRDLQISKLFINFTTAERNGLLIWSKKDKNFVGVGIEKGFLKITYSTNKLAKKVVEVPSYITVSDGLWHSIEIDMVPFSLRIDKQEFQIGSKSDKTFSNSNVSTNGVFYIGGLPENMNMLKETNGMFPYAFQGCIESFATNKEKMISDFSEYDGGNIGVCKQF